MVPDNCLKWRRLDKRWAQHVYHLNNCRSLEIGIQDEKLAEPHFSHVTSDVRLWREILYVNIRRKQYEITANPRKVLHPVREQFRQTMWMILLIGFDAFHYKSDVFWWTSGTKNDPRFGHFFRKKINCLYMNVLTTEAANCSTRIFSLVMPAISNSIWFLWK